MQACMTYPQISNMYLDPKMKVIGISGLARCGKDSFYQISKSILEEKGIQSTRFAFADCLKEECDQILKENIGISAFTENSEEKKIIRPLLVTYGTHIRRKLNENCWIEKIEESVLSKVSEGNVTFITDVRFENEIDWVHSLNGESVHITREGIVPPNKDEAKNNPILKNKSTQLVDWPNFDSIKESDVSNIVNKVLQLIL
jgi:hypothetical protein